MTSQQTSPPLDTGFRPAALFNREYVKAAKKSRKAVPLAIGLEREGGLLSRYETIVEPENTDTQLYAERVVKFLLWARGGWKIHFGGPKEIGEKIRRLYALKGEHAFDAELMSRAYERPFEVALMSADSVPEAKEMSTPLGGHLDGCRIGFDLGASDRKVSAVIDGEAVYTEEVVWDPRNATNPQ